VKLPVDVKSERLMALIEIDPNKVDIVAKTVEKAFKNDPQAKKRVVGGQTIWEITQDETLAEDTELTIEGGGLREYDRGGPAEKEKPKEQEEEPSCRTWPSACSESLDHLDARRFHSGT